MDRRVARLAIGGRGLAVARPSPPRARAFRLLLGCAPKQLSDPSLDPLFFGGCGRRKPTNQGCCSSDVLAGPGELWETAVVFHDPPMRIACSGAYASAIVVVLELTLELSALQLQPVAGVIEFALSYLQLLQL